MAECRFGAFKSIAGCLMHCPQRILFLESIAGVPGMVAATLRHLTSLRLMVGLKN